MIHDPSSPHPQPPPTTANLSVRPQSILGHSLRGKDVGELRESFKDVLWSFPATRPD